LYINLFKFNKTNLIKMILKEYIAEKEKNLIKIGNEIELLNQIDFDIQLIINFDGGYDFFSKDYSKANNFKIKEDNTITGRGSSPDGSYREKTTFLYPMFFFELSKRKLKIPVWIGDGEFKRDEKTTFYKIEETNATGDYAHKRSDPIGTKINSLEEISKNLLKKGIDKNLIKKFNKKAKEIIEKKFY